MIHVVEVSSDSNIGGAGRCILTFLRAFDRTRFRISVVVPRGSLLVPELRALDVPVYELDYLAERSLDRHAIAGLAKLFRQIQPDIVHTHASMSARLAAKRCGIPIVYTRHSVFPPPKRISQGIGKAVNGFINNHTADRIIAVAEAAKDNLTATGVRADKIAVILNGVDALQPVDAAGLADLRRQYGVREGQKAVAIVARLNPVKGHRYFIEAAGLLKKRGVDAKFFIAGTGEEEARLKAQIADLNLGDTVTMLGFLSDVAPLMNLMDVQANCSYGTEATSLSLLEGMSLGKPAVVTDFGGNPGVIQDGVNGFLIPTHNAAAMADALQRLLTDTACYRQMQQNCFKIYEEKFTAAANARSVEAVYQTLYSAKKKRTGGTYDETKV